MAILTLKGLFPAQSGGDVTQLVNSRYCVIVLCVLAVTHVIMTSLHYPSPIHCFCPSHITTSQCDMMATSCLTSDTKKFKMDDADVIPSGNSKKEPFEIGKFYLFAPLLLLLQALLFYTIYVIDRQLTRSCGINTSELSLAALEARRTRNSDDRNSAVRDLASHLQTFCTRQLRRRHVCYGFPWLFGINLSLVQLLAKSLYVLNAIGQFYILNYLLAVDFQYWGWHLIGRQPALNWNMLEIVRDDFRDVSSNFTGYPDIEIPKDLSGLKARTTVESPNNFVCDFETMRLGSLQKYTIHCSLTLNSLNTLIFQHVWFLLFTAAIISLSAVIIQAVRLVVFPCRRMCVRDRLQDMGLLGYLDSDAPCKNIDVFERLRLSPTRRLPSARLYNRRSR